MRNYNFELQRGPRHIRCPQCGKNTFKPYVKTGTNIIVDATVYGRCERINNCNYHQYPKLQGSELDQVLKNYAPAPPQRIVKPKPDFIPEPLVLSTFKEFETNVFINWVASIFDYDTAMMLQAKYNIGTAKGGGTIFWQKDIEGKYRTGKVFYYQSNGKRNKERKSWYVHKKINPDFNLEQVFFGEHLAHEGKPISLCESEKTAVLMSVFEPQYTWLAAGGAQMINPTRWRNYLRGAFVSPDHGQTEYWATAFSAYNCKVDGRVEKAVKAGILPNGADILDLILKQRGYV